MEDDKNLSHLNRYNDIRKMQDEERILWYINSRNKPVEKPPEDKKPWEDTGYLNKI